MCTHSPEGQTYPGMHQKHGQQADRDYSAPLLHFGETPPGGVSPVKWRILEVLIFAPVEAGKKKESVSGQ